MTDGYVIGHYPIMTKSERPTPQDFMSRENSGIEPIWKRKIRQVVAEHGGNERAVSIGSGRSATWIRDQLNRNSSIRAVSLEGLSKYCGKPISWFFSDDDAQIKNRTIQVVGYVGAGGEHFYGDGNEYSEIAAPNYATPDSVAVKIRGDSMGSYLNGWYAIYDDRRDPPTDDMIGSTCIVWTMDGRALVKILRKGSEPGKWTLYSGYGDPIENVDLSAAAIVNGFERGR